MNVALFIFNRPALTAQTFAAIRAARPERLLIVADGPRNDAERAQTDAARDAVERIDWPCEASRNYAHANQGCGRRVSSGLDWVFGQCDDAIILEDDCVPHPDFFRFCTEMLTAYRDDPTVGMVAGHATEERPAPWRMDQAAIWGWATWADRWKNYDYAATGWQDVSLPAGWASFMGNLAAINTWDYQLSIMLLKQHQCCIMPPRCLVRNIGCGVAATHCFDTNDSRARVSVRGLDWPLAAVTADPR